MLRFSFFSIPLLILLLAAAPGDAQTASGAAAAARLTCTQATDQADRLNYAGLIAALGTCESEGRVDDALLFLLLSQVRSRTDTELLFPRDEEAKQRMGAIFAFYYYKAGGSGPDAFYRDAEKRERLFERLAAWEATLGEGYDPGWAYKRLPEPEDVRETSRRHAYNRLQKLRHIAALVSDDEYYHISDRLAEHGRRTNNVIVTNSPEAKEFADLRRMQAEITRRLNVPQPELLPDKVRVDPDPDFRPLHTGANGPAVAGASIAASAADIGKSFLPKALSTAELEAITTSVDFSTEVLVVIAIGKMTNATGSLIVTSLDVANLDDKPSAKIALRVGVTEPDCGFEPTPSYPFIVVAKKRPAPGTVSSGHSWSRGNFADGCKPPVAGAPIE